MLVETYLLIVMSQNVWDCARQATPEDAAQCAEVLARSGAEIYANGEHPAWVDRRIDLGDDPKEIVDLMRDGARAAVTRAWHELRP